MFKNAENLYYVDRYRLDNNSINVKLLIQDLLLYLISFILIAALQICYARAVHMVLDYYVVLVIVLSAFLLFSCIIIKHIKNTNKTLIHVYLNDCIEMLNIGITKYCIKRFLQTAVICLAMFVYPYLSGTELSRLGLLYNFTCIMFLSILFNLHTWRRNKVLIKKYSKMQNIDMLR